MNKKRRNELNQLKFKKRLKNYGFTEEDVKNPTNNLWAFKTTGKPCSCYACQQKEDEYNRAKQKVTDRELTNFASAVSLKSVSEVVYNEMNKKK